MADQSVEELIESSLKRCEALRLQLGSLREQACSIDTLQSPSTDGININNNQYDHKSLSHTKSLYNRQHNDSIGGGRRSPDTDDWSIPTAATARNNGYQPNHQQYTPPITSLFRANAINRHYEDILNNNNKHQNEEEGEYQMFTPSPCTTTRIDNCDIGVALGQQTDNNNSQRRRQPWNIENEYRELLLQVKLVNSARRGDNNTSVRGGRRATEQENNIATTPSSPPSAFNPKNNNSDDQKTATSNAALRVPKLDLQALNQPSPRLIPPSSLAMQSGGRLSKTARGGAPSLSLSLSARKATGRQKYALATSRFETSSGGKQARLVNSPTTTTGGGGDLSLVAASSARGPCTSTIHSSRRHPNTTTTFGAVAPVVVMAADPPPAPITTTQPVNNNTNNNNTANGIVSAGVLPRRETHLRLQTLLANRQQQKGTEIAVVGEAAEKDQSGGERTSISDGGDTALPPLLQEELVPVLNERNESSLEEEEDHHHQHIKINTTNGPAVQEGPVFMVPDSIPTLYSPTSSSTPTITTTTKPPTTNEEEEGVFFSSSWVPPSTSPGFSTLHPPTPGLTLQEDAIGRLLLSHLPPPPQSSSSQNQLQWKCGDIMDCLAKGGRLVRKCWVRGPGGGGGGRLSPSSLLSSSDNLAGAVRVVTCRLINLSYRQHGSSTISSRSHRVQLSYKSRRRGGSLLYPLFPPITALVKKIILPRMPWKPGYSYMVVDTDKGMLRLVPPSVSELAVWALSLSTMLNIAASGGGVEMREMELGETEFSENGVLFQY